MENTSPDSAKDLIAALGRADAALCLGVEEETIRVTIADTSRGGVMPSHWFFALSGLGEVKGVQVSPKLFRQRQRKSRDSAA